jgi:hypothetical protein
MELAYSWFSCVYTPARIPTPPPPPQRRQPFPVLPAELPTTASAYPGPALVIRIKLKREHSAVRLEAFDDGTVAAMPGLKSAGVSHGGKGTPSDSMGPQPIP